MNSIQENLACYGVATIESTPKGDVGWWNWNRADLPCTATTNSFVDCTSANPTPIWVGKQEGINPMSYGIKNAACIAPTAIASITAESDDQKKIDYLNGRASKVESTIERTFYSMFNLHGPKSPRYYKELIAAIKNGEYEIDEKEAKYADEAWERLDEDDNWYDYSVFHGINFTKFPKPDRDGYNAALKELYAEYQKVKDIIAIMPAEEALKAVQDFENWKPSNAPTVQ